MQRRVVEQFSGAVVKAVNSMRQGPPLGHGMMDNGAMTMPGGRGEGVRGGSQGGEQHAALRILWPSSVA